MAASPNMDDVDGLLTVEWTDTANRSHSFEFHQYMGNVAAARYVIRRVQRIIDECVRKHGLEPLEQQALVQIYGAPEQRLSVGQVAERLDLASPALASRLVNKLETHGWVVRVPSETDRRATWAQATPEGAQVLRAIVVDIHREVGHFHGQLSRSDQAAAMENFAFYAGFGWDTGAAAAVSKAAVSKAAVSKAAASKTAKRR